MARKTLLKAGDVVEIIYNTDAADYDKVALNVVTGNSVGLKCGDVGVDVNLRGTTQFFDAAGTDSVGGVSTTTNEILYNNLKLLL